MVPGKFSAQHLSCVSKMVPQNRCCPFVWHRRIEKPSINSFFEIKYE
jgi:hypothetical protein